MKEALPKVSMYSDTIAQFVEEINSRYGMALTFMCLESCEVGHWAEMFQVAKGNNDRLELLQPWRLSEDPPPAEQLQPIQPQLQPEPTQRPQHEQL